MGVCKSKQNKFYASTERKLQKVSQDSEDDEQNTSETLSLYYYNILIDRYTRNLQILMNKNSHIILQLIKTYFYPKLIITPICNTFQSQKYNQFQTLFNMSYDIEDTMSVYTSHVQLHIKGSNRAHYVSKIGIKNLRQMNYIHKNIEGDLETIGSGICCSHTFLTTVYNDCDSGEQKQFLYYAPILKSKKSKKKIFFSLINLPFINMNDRIIDIKCGYEHCLFLTENGIVWSRGNNNKGQIGKHKGILNIPTMSKIEYDINENGNDNNGNGNNIPKIKAISCGYDNNLMIDINNNLWIFGDTSHGQLGMVSYNEFDIIWQAICHPYFKNKNIKLNNISCGSKHSLCIDNNGKCYLFGRNAFGEIGNNECNTMQYIPYIFQTSDKKFKNMIIIDGKCGEWHTVLLNKANDVITFGKNIHYECSILREDDESICKGYIVDREKEMGINKDDYITAVIVSKACTFIIVDMVKTRIMQITKDINHY